ncbi:uncharacterized oxidoreductase MexAM1_META1p0182-like [Oppia nitens]|uniref:uncharacterized oxidoreductase MexAM1_META1p0182-like n=1 Tax=Oppia nitens TaxID=1686743 RepID=UPI0023DA6C19|nr:uncharacterized oxidoreductase MexAM1_META1p0182-like [Oppia nitens]
MSVNYNFDGKVALITGSSSGIGAAIAELFAKSGASVVITGHRSDDVARVASRCSQVLPANQLSADRLLEVVADFASMRDIERLVDQTVRKFGKLDILVNCAGLFAQTRFEDRDYYSKYHRVMMINLNSAVYLTHLCVDELAKTRGAVINISSIRSLVSCKQNIPYNISKAGLDMFTKCLAAELGPKGIRVNSVNPGCVMTNILTNNLGISREESEQIDTATGAQYPVGRCGQGLDIANLVGYLASSEASFITGSIVVADGGHLAANVPTD